jgi:putative FmdB family regulatory protein
MPKAKPLVLGTIMPIFAYRCRACGNQFQTLVRSSETPVCAACHSADLDQQLSLIAKPSKGGEAGVETSARCAGMGGCGCGEGVCPALGQG